MSNSAPNGRFSRLVSTGNTVSREEPRSSVGAGYRCGVRPCQTLKSPEKRFFFRGLWTSFRARERTLPEPTYRYCFAKRHIRQAQNSSRRGSKSDRSQPGDQAAAKRRVSPTNHLILNDFLEKAVARRHPGALRSVYG